MCIPPALQIAHLGKLVFPNRSRPISTYLESTRPNLTYLDHHFCFFCGYLLICASVSCMILSGHDSVLGSCHIFRVFGCFLPRWKKFWISLFGRGSRRSSLGFRHNSDLRLTALICGSDPNVSTIQRLALDARHSTTRLPFSAFRS